MTALDEPIGTDTAEPNLAGIAAAGEEPRPAAILRGGTRGLEILIQGRARAEDIVAALAARLGEAPAFFRGCDARVRVEDGPLPAGCLGQLDDLATRHDLRIVEVRAADPVPRPSLAAGSARAPVDLTAAEPARDGAAAADGAVDPAPLPPAAPVAPVPDLPVEAAPFELAAPIAAPASAPIARPVADTPELPEIEAVADPSQTRTIVGPVRSGVILEHVGHLVIVGDVNPGALVRAGGNIIVLGRLRGTAHAGIGADLAFIMALRLEPQQLRIGQKVARAGDKDAAAAHPEIAHVTGGNIVVERYQGRLPAGLAASIQ